MYNTNQKGIGKQLPKIPDLKEKILGHVLSI